MATVKKVWNSPEVSIESASLGSATEASPEYSTAVDLETAGYAGCQIQIDLTADADPADTVVVGFFASLDGTVWDDSPFYAIDIGDSDRILTVLITDVAHFKVGCWQNNATDVHSIDIEKMEWRWDAT
mgnify:CR=1 FL=1